MYTEKRAQEEARARLIAYGVSKQIKETLANETPELEHVETVIRKGKMTPILQCPKCGKKAPFPSCCGEPMDLEHREYKCSNSECKNTFSVPKCCKEEMLVAIDHI